MTDGDRQSYCSPSAWAVCRLWTALNRSRLSVSGPKRRYYYGLDALAEAHGNDLVKNPPSPLTSFSAHQLPPALYTSPAVACVATDRLTP